MATGPRGMQKSSEPRGAEGGSRPFPQNFFCSGVDQIQLTLQPRTPWSNGSGGRPTPRPRDMFYTQCTSRAKKVNTARGSGTVVPTLRRSDFGQEKTEKFRQGGHSTWTRSVLRRSGKEGTCEKVKAMDVIQSETEEGATSSTRWRNHGGDTRNESLRSVGQYHFNTDGAGSPEGERSECGRRRDEKTNGDNFFNNDGRN